ncbi:MAG: hypothetical protein ACM3N5_04240 [Candidatus Eiseniibacteriota bacterium]
MYLSPLKPHAHDDASTPDARPTDSPSKNANAALLLAVVLVTAFSLSLTINDTLLPSVYTYSQAPASDR